MSTYITTHNSKREASFSKKVPEEQYSFSIPIGSIKTLWSNHAPTVNLSTEDDIDEYAHDRTNDFPRGQICPANGSPALSLDLRPGAVSVMHRTMSLDVIVVTEGEIELHLDSGDKRIVRPGDCIVQRATMHRWTNVTPGHGWARMIVFGQAVEQPMHIGGVEMGPAWDT